MSWCDSSTDSKVWMEGDAVTFVIANVPIRITYDKMYIILAMKQRPQSFLWGFLCLERKKEFMERTMEQNTQKKDKIISTRKLAVTGMLSAVAFILMYLEIPIPIMPSFVKFDFSDLPALVGAFALGPVWGVIIELVKNLLHLAVSQSMFIGELSNFILGGTFVLVAGLIYQRKKTRKNAFLAGLIGALVMGIVSIFSNYFLVYPVYIKAYFDGSLETCLAMYNAICWEVADTGVGPHLFEIKSLMQALLIFNLPFTFIKGMISVGISMLVYKPLSKFIKG